MLYEYVKLKTFFSKGLLMNILYVHNIVCILHIYTLSTLE